MLQQYFQPRSYQSVPMNEQFERIGKWIRHYRNDQEHEVKVIIKTIEGKLMKLQFRKQEKENSQWLVILKSLMLVHQLLCTGVNGNTFEQLLQTISISLQNLNQYNISYLNNSTTLSHHITPPNPTFHLTLYQKLLQPYHHYITRRCQMLPKSFTQQHKVHYLINLMNTASNCNEVIYILARYRNFDVFGVGAGVNLLLARDVGMLYGLLRGYLKVGAMEEIKNNEVNKDSGQLLLKVQDIDDILLELHQKLFHIFYNKYHYIQADPHVPHWIDLETHYHHQRKIKLPKTPQKSLLLTTFTKDNNSTCLDDTNTSIFSSQKGTKWMIDENTMEKSLQLIEDLEKFLECYDSVMV